MVPDRPPPGHHLANHPPFYNSTQTSLLQAPLKALSQRDRTTPRTELDPTDARAHYLTAEVYRRLGRTEESKREMNLFETLKSSHDRLVEVYSQMRRRPPLPTDSVATARSEP